MLIDFFLTLTKSKGCPKEPSGNSLTFWVCLLAFLPRVPWEDTCLISISCRHSDVARQPTETSGSHCAWPRNSLTHNLLADCYTLFLYILNKRDVNVLIGELQRCECCYICNSQANCFPLFPQMSNSSFDLLTVQLNRFEALLSHSTSSPACFLYSLRLFLYRCLKILHKDK